MNTVTTGIVAGAAGTTMLDAVTYLDMAIRGRPASTVPEKTVESVATALGVAIPGRGDALAARRSAFGALGGIAVGTGLGVAAALVRRAGARLTPAAGTIGIGLAAMAATDIPIAMRGISDPRQWTAQDWLSDLVPHLVYGATVTTVLRQQDEATGNRREPGAERSSTVRSAVIGVASGLRSSTGIAAALLSGAPGSAHWSRLVGATALVGGELVADKNPNVPSRLSQPALTGRLIAGGGGAAALARRDRADTASALIIGTVGALAGSCGGAWWRQWAGRRMPDWQAALAEDAVALTMAAAALRRPARPSSVSASS
ncbi:hypothetical protein WSS_A24530 [Rhodococcus opacus M213]|uniref:DUF4126 domain-containing protein n=2 Tax=Rhodococcus opacus TaxID=37919 RepID=K8XNX1_RHOOP|nr:hypothetical protein [Rhodococcus opacus]ANS28923.1 hypothetical protein R1CP_21235 [Rhodococcus opacus]EKT79922.1 hypothetical protein WSS_A24530 [Rhodococcus opacus M213]